MMQHCVVNNVRKGIGMGIYRENLNVDFVSRIYFSGVISIKDHLLFPQEMFATNKLQDDFLEYHLRGIITPEGRKFLNQLINSNHE
jgi:hypothetical protein